jgi:hypothetical protein
MRRGDHVGCTGEGELKGRLVRLSELREWVEVE